MHSVHHQSEEYNLSVALRQPWLESIISPVFYLPLAVLGFPPVMYLGGVTIDTLYQFWIHTRAVGKLGPVEWIMNTPSHHRVHHGIDPQYVDRNYAGIFIVWDRLFGTYEPRGARAGLRNGEGGAHLEPARREPRPLGGALEDVRAPRDRSSTRCAYGSRRPSGVPPISGDRRDRAACRSGDASALRRSRAARRRRRTSRCSSLSPSQPRPGTSGWSRRRPRRSSPRAPLVFVATVVAWGGLLEKRRWAWPLELVRLTAGVALLAVAWRGAP